MSASPAEPAAFGGRLFKGRLLQRRVRREVAARLMRDQGLSYRDAQALVDEKVTEEVIHKAAVKAEADVGAIGDGSFLNWLKEHGPQLMQIVEIIVSLLSVFAAERAKAAAKPRKK